MKKSIFIVLALIITFCIARYAISACQPQKIKDTARTRTYSADSLAMNNKAFGTWNNKDEIRSYKALSQNIHRDTMLFLGSSEFNHGEKTDFHVRRLFRRQNISIMLIGHQYNQSLNQAVTVGALSPQLKKRKVVLVISPTWFFPGGISASGYDKVFSLSSYMAFMENKRIPRAEKRYVARRSEYLLSADKDMLAKVKLCNKIYIDNKISKKNKDSYALVKHKVTVNDTRAVKKALTAAGIKRLDHYNGQIDDPAPLDWKKLQARALGYERSNISGHMFISTERWKNGLGARYTYSRNRYAGASFRYSPEYDDLACFLRICRSQNIQVMLMVLPVNGQWYDYCGLYHDSRKYVSEKVSALGRKYDARVVDFRDYEYKPYFLEDNVHPWRLGWLKMNKAVYDYYFEKIKNDTSATAY